MILTSPKSSEKATRYLCDRTESIELFEKLLHESLTSLFKELRDSNWYIREREIVNLFTFGHLVPRFLEQGLDLTMIGIEVPTLSAPRTEKAKIGSPKDLVIWAEPRTTLWKGCELFLGMDLKTLRVHGRKPFAIIEWTATNRIRDTAAAQRVQRDHKYDIEGLIRNLDGGMMTIGYAILVEQRVSPIRMISRRIDRKSTRLNSS